MGFKIQATVKGRKVVESMPQKSRPSETDARNWIANNNWPAEPSDVKVQRIYDENSGY